MMSVSKTAPQLVVGTPIRMAFAIYGKKQVVAAVSAEMMLAIGM